MNNIMKRTYEIIDEGNNSNDEYLLLDIKRRLYKNKDYKNYMDRYNELMYIVMKIKYKLTTSDKINKTIDNISMLQSFLEVLK